MTTKITDTSEMSMAEMHKALNSRALNLAQGHVDLRHALRGVVTDVQRAQAWIEYCERDMSELAEAIAERAESNETKRLAGNAQAKLKAWPAPKPNFGRSCANVFNSFQRDIACPPLSFRSLCETFKIAEIKLGDAVVGRIIEHGPDKYLFIDNDNVEYGYETLSSTKAMFVYMVCENHTIASAWATMRDRLENEGF